MTGTKTKKKVQQTTKKNKQSISQAHKKAVTKSRVTSQASTAGSSRTSTIAPSIASKTSSQAPSKRATVEVSEEDDDEPTSIGGTLDKDTVMELASDSESDEDDDEDELGMSTLLLASYMADFLYRAAYQGMDSTHLCILQTCPYH
jgi:hypothetical protein